MKWAAPLARGVASVVTVVAAIVVSNRSGDNAGKLVAAVVGAGLIVLIEWFVQWSPTHLDWARAIFDPRVKWEGLWFQTVKSVRSSRGITTDPNTCSVLLISYVKGENGYELCGDAFDRDGETAADYDAERWPTFTRDGKHMSYVWSGSVTDPVQEEKGADRSGLANVRLTEADRNHGKGLVQHVGMDREMKVEMDRLTDEYIKNVLHIDGYTATSLLERNPRIAFGRLAAKQLAASKSAVGGGPKPSPVDPPSS